MAMPPFQLIDQEGCKLAFLKDSLLVIGRIYTIYPLLLAVTLYMGRRSIGQLPVFDFLIFLSLGSVVGADIADPRVQHVHTAVAIIAIGIMQKLFSYFLIKSGKFGKWMTFEPVVVLKDGQFLRRNLKKLQYSVDDILRMLREQSIFDAAQVEVAILEGNGELSVLKKAIHQETTPSMLGMPNSSLGLSYAVVKEGKPQLLTLGALHLSEDWLEQKLSSLNLKIEDVFFATLDESKKLTVTSYQQEPKVDVFFR